MQSKKSKKPKPFWKRLDPEIKSFTDHIGKIIDNSNVQQIMDALLYLGLAYIGAEKTKDLRGAVIGPLGLKLARAENIVSGAAGVALLTGLGLSFIPTREGELGGPRQIFVAENPMADGVEGGPRGITFP